MAKVLEDVSLASLSKLSIIVTAINREVLACAFVNVLLVLITVDC